MRERTQRPTAWYGQSGHPAELVSCPTCYAGAGAGCTLTLTLPGCSVGPVGTPITGLHAERIAVSNERFPTLTGEVAGHGDRVREYVKQRLVS